MAETEEKCVCLRLCDHLRVTREIGRQSSHSPSFIPAPPSAVNLLGCMLMDRGHDCAKIALLSPVISVGAVSSLNNKVWKSCSIGYH